MLRLRSKIPLYLALPTGLFCRHAHGVPLNNARDERTRHGHNEKPHSGTLATSSSKVEMPNNADKRPISSHAFARMYR